MFIVVIDDVKSNDSSVHVALDVLELEDVLSRGSAAVLVRALVLAGERASSESRLAAHCMHVHVLSYDDDWLHSGRYGMPMEHSSALTCWFDINRQIWKSTRRLFELVSECVAQISNLKIQNHFLLVPVEPRGGVGKSHDGPANIAWGRYRCACITA